VINWAMISLAHLKFREAKTREGVTPKFKALLYPLGNYVCLLFLAGILVIMYLTPGIQISVILIPVWLIILGISYRLRGKNSNTAGIVSK
jgi:aromatic amino acid transport protein AroP